MNITCPTTIVINDVFSCVLNSFTNATSLITIDFGNSIKHTINRDGLQQISDKYVKPSIYNIRVTHQMSNYSLFKTINGKFLKHNDFDRKYIF